MMKLKHNKKRNTAILYEILVREYAKASMKQDIKTKNRIISLIKESFAKDTALAKELQLYKALLETRGISLRMAEKLLIETKTSFSNLDQKQIFNEQSALISTINKEVSKDAFTNFVPNYKNIATVHQIFNNPKMPPKGRVLLEENIIKTLTSNQEETKKDEMQPIDNLIFKSFVKKFNEEYSELHEEQVDLLKRYVFSMDENQLEFKMYLNEEIHRLKENLKLSKNTSEVKNDEEIKNKIEKVFNLVESFKNKQIDQSLLKKVMKVQNLVRELKEDGNNI